MKPSTTGSGGKCSPGHSKVAIVAKEIQSHLLGEDKAQPLLPHAPRKEAVGPAFTVLMLANYMTGSGFLNQPQVFRESGIAATSLLYIVAGLATWLEMVILVDAGERLRYVATGVDLEEADLKLGGRWRSGSSSATASRSSCSDSSSSSVSIGGVVSPANNDDDGLDDGPTYTSLAGATYGAEGRTAVDASITLVNSMTMLSYLIVIGDLTSGLMATWLGATGVWASVYVACPLMVVIFVLPSCLMRHFSDLRWMAALSVISIFGAMGLVLFASQTYATAEDVPHTPLLWWDTTGALSKLGSIVFCMGCAEAVFHAYRPMVPRTQPQWRRVSAWGVVLGGSSSYITGLVGYLAFRDATDGDILSNFTGSAAGVFQFLMVLHLCFYVPNQFVVMRNSVTLLLGKGEAALLPRPQFVGLTLSILGFLVALVLGLSALGVSSGAAFGYLTDIAGGVFGSLLSFIFPALFYLRAYGSGKDATWLCQARALAAFGSAVMVVVLVATLIEMAGG